MQYGYFDDEAREYVITRPDTPAPWANYLGSTDYGAIISNHAGGYSFRKSGANGRILRYIFNDNDQPGRYIYIRDNESKDYWSASWQPVGKDTELYRSECHHGIAYTRMIADYADIHSEALYYVPAGEEHEVWNITLTNRSDRTRKLTVTGFCAFTNEGNYEQDQVNLQYTLFITQTHFRGSYIQQIVNENDIGNEVSRVFALAGADVSSYCGDREDFPGRYRTFANPVGVEKGDLGNRLNYTGNSCGALSFAVELAPGESCSASFLVAEKNERETDLLLEKYADPKAQAEAEIGELKKIWGERLSTFRVKTPDESFNTMVNVWNAYNCFMTFLWSRAASFIYCGLRNGYGYRDTVQDIQGVIHLAPAMAKEELTFMLSAQVSNGAGLPLVKYTHDPGHENTPDDPEYVRETGHPAYRADDALWLFPTVWKYIVESGDTAYLDEEIPFADRGEGTVYEHLQRAIDFSLKHLGPHGMPAGLYADWNDCLRLGENGESTFVAFQFYWAFSILEKFASFRKDEKTLTYLEKKQKELRSAMDAVIWNEDRFVRGFRETGEVIGQRTDPEANMWLNPQSWSVISGYASDAQSDTALERVHELLNTEYGAMLMVPPYTHHGFDGARMVLFNPYVKENAGIFSQTQGWIILAEALKGHGDRAFEYFKETAPAAMNDRAEIRVMEPYCHGQFTEGAGSPYAGRSHVHWLTGTASTVMVGCVEGILGMRPDLYGLAIRPAIPSPWDGLEIDKDFRGRHLHIVVKNPGHVCSGFRSMTVNGEEKTEPYIREDEMTDLTEIVLYLS
ncbi:MAG: N,N'-diacetylchitobiose phosphorylase [Eubacterium sp.]|nr:N,N'-diacetylchitobiose phosphorylase [Eubacterium sp.]